MHRAQHLSYNEPSWIAQRHRIQNAEPVVNEVMAAPRAMSRRVTDAR
jgi:hypothetical protein